MDNDATRWWWWPQLWLTKLSCCIVKYDQLRTLMQRAQRLRQPSVGAQEFSWIFHNCSRSWTSQRLMAICTGAGFYSMRS